MLETVFDPTSSYLGEGRTMLADEFGPDYGKYFTILAAISSGQTTSAEIKNLLGVEVGGCLAKLEITIMTPMFAILLVMLVVAAVSAVGAHRAAERARRSGRMADGRFLLAFSGLLARMAMADGTVSADEVETVEKMFADMGLSQSERALCVGNFVLVQREGGDAKALARVLAGSFNQVTCRFLYGLVLRVALADWRIADAEEKLLTEIGGALGLSEDERAEFRQGVTPTFDREALEDAGVPAQMVRLGMTGGIKDAGLGIWDR